jgi:hypothetical protein
MLFSAFSARIRSGPQADASSLPCSLASETRLMDSFSAHQTPLQSSDRAFGCVMAGFFTLVAAYPLLSGKPPHWWAAALAAAFLLPALLFPRLLAPLNMAWTRFGLVLSSVMGPIALAVLFFGVITPYGFLMKKLRKNVIPVRFEPAAQSYWVARDPAGPEPESLKDQF